MLLWRKRMRWQSCRRGSLEWIMNMQDREGNTALHLAIKDGNLGIFRDLFGCTQVNLNLTNAEKQTPLDIALYQLRPSFYDVTVIVHVSSRFTVVIVVAVYNIVLDPTYMPVCSKGK